MFTQRIFEKADAEAVSSFVQSAEELFYMFPKATYPLDPNVLYDESLNRHHPTVVLREDTVVAYGNFIFVEQDICSIGNVIVRPGNRGQGVASYLVNSLTNYAFQTLRVSRIKISCFNTNTSGLLLYSKLGFEPREIEERVSYKGEKVALFHLYKDN